MVTVETLAKDDLLTINSVKPHDWHDLTPIHSMYLDSEICYPFKVVTKGEMAGIGTAIVYGDTAWLAHIIVGERFRKSGIGSAIVEHLLGFLDSRHRVETITLTATDMGYPLYLRHGFETQSEYVIYVTETSPQDLSDASQVKPAQQSHLDEMKILDAEGSGEMRYPLLKNYADDSFVYAPDGQFLGYYIPGFGEGPIIAKTEQAGIELLKLKIRTCQRVVAPAENAAAADFLLEQGYSVQKRIPRMIRGRSFTWRPEWNYSRIGGYAG